MKAEFKKLTRAIAQIVANILKKKETYTGV